MFRDSYNIIPMSMAAILHVIIFGLLFVAFDFTSRAEPFTPLAVTATLVVEDQVVTPPPPVEQPQETVELPEPEPEPKPEIVEPEPEEPDPAEEERARLEEQALIEEQKREQERIAREQELERQRQAKLEAERKAEEERRLEEERRQKELERQRDIERQREENRREEQRLQEFAQQEELQEEAERIAALNSGEAAAYQAAMVNKVRRNWIRPATAPDDLECFVSIRQLTNGHVVDARVTSCNADDVVVRSIVAAVNKASPLPTPRNPILFLPDFQFRFTIQE